MAVYSKLLSESVKFGIYIPKMWIFEATNTLWGVLLPIAGALTLCLASFYLFKLLGGDYTVRIRDSSKNHNWKSIGASSKSWYCSICELLLINGIGVFCDCCGIYCDPDCVKKANKKLACKVIIDNKEIHEHHWIKGNLPFESTCIICNKDCSVDHGLVDYRCCWCQKTVHTKCMSHVNKECDFGEFRNMIVPPECIQVAKRKGSFHKNLLLRGVKDPGWEDWSPLIVVANQKSGNGDGGNVLSEFRKWLNPVQIIDLAERKPLAALQWCVMIAPRQVRVLVAGGDGTVAWVLTTAHKLDLDPEPAIGILPLGTGNDLSRVLGWGKENKTDLETIELMRILQNASTSHLDRWEIEINTYRHLGLRIPSKIVYMYNYMSVGVDAQVALDFHRTRDSSFYLFSNRLFNKLLYLCFGTQQVVTANCKNLEQRIDLWLDGKHMKLPELESVVILNIPSWGAGVNLWGMLDRPSYQSFNDGVLEVLGIYSSFHIAQLQMGLSSPLRLGQAKIVEIRLKSKAPIQVDGEPWEQSSSKIIIKRVNRASVLIPQENLD